MCDVKCMKRYRNTVSSKGIWTLELLFSWNTFWISRKSYLIQQDYTSSISVVQHISEDILWLIVVIYFLVHSLSALSTSSTTSSSFPTIPTVTVDDLQRADLNLLHYAVCCTNTVGEKNTMKEKKQVCSFLVGVKWVCL